MFSNSTVSQRVFGIIVFISLLVILGPNFFYIRQYIFPEYSLNLVYNDLPSVPKFDAILINNKLTLKKLAITQAWVLNVGSVETKQQAIELSDSLKKQGYAAFYTESKIKNNYIVYIGPELDYTKIEKLRDTIKQNNQIRFFEIQNYKDMEVI